MDTLKRIEIEQACLRLCMDYTYYIDGRQADAFIDLFIPDGTWILPGFPAMHGHAEMRGYLERRDPKTRSRHVFSNVLVDVIDETTARGRAYTVDYRHVGDEVVAPLEGPNGITDVADEYRLTSAGWKFLRREGVRTFGRKRPKP